MRVEPDKYGRVGYQSVTLSAIVGSSVSREVPFIMATGIHDTDLYGPENRSPLKPARSTVPGLEGLPSPYDFLTVVFMALRVSHLPTHMCRVDGHLLSALA